MRDGGQWLAAAVLTVGLCSVVPLGSMGSLGASLLFYGVLKLGKKYLPEENDLPDDSDLKGSGGYYKFSDLMSRLVTQKLNILVASGLALESLYAYLTLLSFPFAMAAALGTAIGGTAVFAGFHLLCDAKIFPTAAPWMNRLYMGLAAGLVGGVGMLGTTWLRGTMLRLVAEVAATKVAMGAGSLALLTTTVATATPGGAVGLAMVKLMARSEVSVGGEGKCGSACTCNAGPI